MTAVIKNELGTITMNEELIASIAGFAAGENYGIVAMNSKTAGDALLQLVGLSLIHISEPTRRS